jgi:hypothetical protein
VYAAKLLDPAGFELFETLESRMLFTCPYGLPIKLALSVVFLPKERDLLEISWMWLSFWCPNRFWLLPLIILLFLNPLLDLD